MASSENMKAITSAAIENLLSRSDKAKIVYECDVPPQPTPVTEDVRYFACIICHEDNTKGPDAYPSGVVLAKANGAEQVVFVSEIPLCSGVRYDISQTSVNSSNSVDGIQTGSLIKITLANETVSVVFRDNSKMAKFVEELRNRIRLADVHGLKQQMHFDWLAYTDNVALGSKTSSEKTATSSGKKASPTLPKAESVAHAWDSVSKSDPDILPYTALLQRSSTMRSTKTNGYGDLSRRLTQRRDSFEVKKAWLSARMRDREDEFVDWQDISVFAGTWNVHGSTPDESLAPWLLGNATENESAIEPDIYIIGLQEIDLSTEAYLMYDPTRENAWCEAVMQGLGNRAQKYTKLASQQLVSMLIIVLAKESLSPHISEVSATYTGVGLMGIMASVSGNKGCVSVRFRLYDSYMCALSSHLAAFMNQVERRNQDYAEICKRLVFPNVPDETTEYATSLWNDGGDEGVSFIESSGVIRNWNQQNSIFHSDHLVWVGDLNYRINLTEAEVKAALRKRDLASLIEYDQLTIEREGGRTFHVFDEGQIDFLPTYKYDAGTNRYDTSEKRRAPAWTDRVLWRKARAHLEPHANEGHHSDIQLTSYASCMDIMMSDHKPVNAIMRLKARKIDVERQAKVKSDIVKRVVENREDRGPDARISNSFVEFGDVRFMTEKEVSITLENTGQMVDSWCFIPKLNEAVICKPWLEISKLSGVLGPGEQTVIDFRILIDATTASTFNNDQDQIADMLILRLEDGKDFFLVISGNYIPTCFGMSLEKLAKIKFPVHSANIAQQAEPGTRSPSPEASQNGTVPKEIWRMLNFLWNKNMLELDDLFLESGDLLLAQYIQKCLDTGDEFDNSILLGTQDSDQEKPSDSTSTTLDTHTPDSSPIARRKSREDEAIDSLKQSDVPNTIEEQTTSTDDTESEGLNREVSPTIGANSMIDVLVAFLESLPEPVIPSSLHKRLIDGTLSPNVTQLKDYMSAVHHNVLLYIVDFLRDAIKHCPANRVEKRTQRIVDVFAAALIRPPVTYNDRNPKLTWRKRQQALKSLLA